MSKAEFVAKLKDPLYAETMRLDALVTSLVDGNKVETIPGRTLMYITVFMHKTLLHDREKRDLEHKVRCATKGWYLEAVQFDEMHSQISMGFRAK